MNEKMWKAEILGEGLIPVSGTQHSATLAYLYQRRLAAV